MHSIFQLILIASECEDDMTLKKKATNKRLIHICIYKKDKEQNGYKTRCKSKHR